MDGWKRILSFLGWPVFSGAIYVRQTLTCQGLVVIGRLGIFGEQVPWDLGLGCQGIGDKLPKGDKLLPPLK